MAAPCIIPVAAGDALKWLAGDLTDTDLLIRAPIKCEAMYIVSLPDRAGLFALVRRMMQLHAAGCVTMVARASNERMLPVWEKAGCERFYRQPNGQWRFWASPQNLDRWITWLKRHGRASS